MVDVADDSESGASVISSGHSTFTKNSKRTTIFSQQSVFSSNSSNDGGKAKTLSFYLGWPFTSNHLITTI